MLYPDPILPKRTMVVCYSVFYGGYDKWQSLQHNMEYNRLMGADHFFLYNMRVGPNVTALLQYYIDLGIRHTFQLLFLLIH